MPVQITKFEPRIDANWAEKNTNIDTSSNFQMSARNDQVFIEDEKSGTRFSLLELSHILRLKNEAEKYGEFTKEEFLEDGYIIASGKRLKLIS